jgi:type VI protein secretion system component VasK
MFAQIDDEEKKANRTKGTRETFMDWTVWDVMWSMFVFFFWFMYIWIFITIFADIFRRDDIHGWSKAGWIILLIFIPLIGALIYMIRRPKMTEQDKRMMEEAEQRQKRAAGYSAAEEIAKAQQLKDSGAISDEEFQELKRKAMA